MSEEEVREIQAEGGVVAVFGVEAMGFAAT
jgi:hypothetical protein